MKGPMPILIGAAALLLLMKGKGGGSSGSGESDLDKLLGGDTGDRPRLAVLEVQLDQKL